VLQLDQQKFTARKMMVKLTPGVNFINILLAAFKCAHPKSAKRQSSCQSFFGLSGSWRAKAARKMIVKLTPAILL